MRRFWVSLGSLLVIVVAVVAAKPVPADAKAADPEDVTSFMKHRLNPAFTDVSFHLFHAGGTAEAARPALDKAVARLQAVAEELTRLPPPAEDEALAFRLQAHELQHSVVGLKEALAGGGAPAEVTHWFNHVSATCASCHALYRD